MFDPIEGHLHLLFQRRRGDIAENRTVPPSVDPARACFVGSVVSPDGDGANWFDKVGGRALTLPFSYDETNPVVGAGADWTTFLAGPGHGIAMPDGTLLAPAWCYGKDGYRSVILRYDRSARRWSVSGTMPGNSNECSLAISSTGKLIVDGRRNGGGGRTVGISSDYGASWDSVTFDTALPDPGCMGSVWTSALPGEPRYILFVNPASNTGRTDLEIKLSVDDHRTFPVKRRLYPVSPEPTDHSWEGRPVFTLNLPRDTAYSDLVQLGGQRFGALIEQRVRLNGGGHAINRVMSLVVFNVSWLIGA